MDLLIDTIFVVFGEMMLQQTMHNMKYNWNEHTIYFYFALKNQCVLFALDVFVCNANWFWKACFCRCVLHSRIHIKYLIRVTRNLYLSHIIKNYMVDTMCGCICNQLFADILFQYDPKVSEFLVQRPENCLSFSFSFRLAITLSVLRYMDLLFPITSLTPNTWLTINWQEAFTIDYVQ